MSKRYTKKTSRSRRKSQVFNGRAVKVSLVQGQASIQMVLPLQELMGEVARWVEELASQTGLLLMKGLIDEEVQQLVGAQYIHNGNRQAYRWGMEEGHVIFAGRKVGIQRPRVRSVEGKEIPLERYGLFQCNGRLQQAVQQRLVRGVSTRDYEGVIDDLCDGYGIRKSSVSRQWKAASGKTIVSKHGQPISRANRHTFWAGWGDTAKMKDSGPTQGVHPCGSCSIPFVPSGRASWLHPHWVITVCRSVLKQNKSCQNTCLA